MKRIKIESVQPGDILFTARPGKVSKSIRFATEGVVSHAMICVQIGSFIASTSDGVQARNLQRELFKDDENVYHFRLKDLPDRSIIEQIVDFARAEVGARYSIIEAVRSVVATGKPRSKRQFCSRLVARVYRQAGIELVPDADYCSPEELRRSTRLAELPVKTEQVTDEEQAWLTSQTNPIQATHDAQNAVLEFARTIDPEVENFNDLYRLIVERSDVDPEIAAALRESGYLDLWRLEGAAHPWRYVRGLMVQVTAPPELIREYCLGTVREAYSGGVRFAINLVALRELFERYPRQSLSLEIELYETLVTNDQIRREIAIEWLSTHFPQDLATNLEQIDPHTPY